MVIERRKTARFAACPSMFNPVNVDLCTTIIPKPVIPSAASAARNPRGCFQRWFPMHPLPRRADRGRQNGIVAMIQPRLPVIPSAARNLKSITTRPVSLCHAYVVTNSGKQRENSPGRLYLETDILDSSTPLRCAQNDSDGVAFSSMESGAIVKCIPLSAPADGETSYPNLSPAGERHREGGLRNSTHGD